MQIIRLFLILLVMSFKASESFATETIDAESCIEAQSLYSEVITRVDQKFKSAANEIGLNQLFFYPENALTTASVHGCELVKFIHTKRASSPRPILRPSNFQRSMRSNAAETNLEDILRALTQNIEASADKPRWQSGPPLTGNEKDRLRKQVGKCWEVDVKSRSADVIVTIAMKMQPDGKVIASSIELISFSGGGRSDADVAFQSGRRAILRCQKDGYNLPKNKYNHWRNVEITFDPSAMRQR